MSVMQSSELGDLFTAAVTPQLAGSHITPRPLHRRVSNTSSYIPPYTSATRHMLHRHFTCVRIAHLQKLRRRILPSSGLHLTRRLHCKLRGPDSLREFGFAIGRLPCCTRRLVQGAHQSTHLPFQSTRAGLRIRLRTQSLLGDPCSAVQTWQTVSSSEMVIQLSAGESAVSGTTVVAVTLPSRCVKVTRVGLTPHWASIVYSSFKDDLEDTKPKMSAHSEQISAERMSRVPI